MSRLCAAASPARGLIFTAPLAYALGLEETTFAAIRGYDCEADARHEKPVPARYRRPATAAA